MKNKFFSGLVVFSIIIATYGFINYEGDDKKKKGKKEQTNTQVKTPNFGFTPAPTFNDLNFRIYPKTFREIKSKRLIGVQKLDDFVPNYPTNWIHEYKSVEISYKNENVNKSFKGPNNILTDAQKGLLENLKFGDHIRLIVKFNILNAITQLPEEKEIDMMLSLVPNENAYFLEGENILANRLKEKSAHAFEGKNIEKLLPLSVLFTIDKNGLTKDVKVRETSGDAEIDETLVKLIEQNPLFQPAKTENGEPVEQVFEMFFGVGGC